MCSEGRPYIAHIMSWAADRKTTRVEDRAYSLLGLFGVNMPMLYGEGSKAFQRLQLEIIRVSSDHSIFAWNRKGQLGKYGSVLADDPSCFRGCHDIENVDPDEFAEEVEEYIRKGELAVATDQGKLLPFGGSVDPAQLLRWDVTNLGIQVSLPVLLSRHNNACYKTILPCSDRYGNLITIDLESRGHRSCHTYLSRHHFPVYTSPQFRSLYLDCPQQPRETSYKLWLKDGDTSSHGFTRCGSFPREVVGDTVTFSQQGDTIMVLVYANQMPDLALQLVLDTTLVKHGDALSVMNTLHSKRSGHRGQTLPSEYMMLCGKHPSPNFPTLLRSYIFPDPFSM
ncbi:hypothetical protein BKA83DRAFT_595498 [Pisolithus microcarpus]|nr:hypothetical protein BKA83DRAFT_595498 [Pisolithus microcarpus]